MNVYLVMQKGVYRQGIGGIFNAMAQAVSVADQLAQTDVDDHHEYVVYEIPLNEATQAEKVHRRWGQSRPHDFEPIYVARKQI